jgi:hypothetical protein
MERTIERNKDDKEREKEKKRDIERSIDWKGGRGGGGAINEKQGGR